MYCVLYIHVHATPHDLHKCSCFPPNREEAASLLHAQGSWHVRLGCLLLAACTAASCAFGGECSGTRVFAASWPQHHVALMMYGGCVEPCAHPPAAARVQIDGVPAVLMQSHYAEIGKVVMSHERAHVQLGVIRCCLSVDRWPTQSCQSNQLTQRASCNDAR